LLPKNEDDEEFDAKKIKKIEFSQSFKKEKLDKSLPFTHSAIDKLVFKQDQSFKLEEA
jgi:hypothetical protein